MSAWAEKYYPYQQYISIAREHGDEELFKSLENLAPCILHVLTEKLAWQISRELPRGPEGDWLVAKELIAEEFNAGGGRRILDSQLFLSVVLKCVFVFAYKRLQVDDSTLVPIFEAASPEGYLNSRLKPDTWRYKMSPWTKQQNTNI